MAPVTVGLVLCALWGVSGSPVKRVYDQRQQGELNIHAQLDNIIIVLIPTSKISLSEPGDDNLVASKPDKNTFLQFLQKYMKNDIDRVGVQEEAAAPHDDNEVISQQVALQVDKDKVSAEKEEEVVATVEEMKPSEVTEKTTSTPKLEATEDTPIKEHSTVSETVQQTVFKVSIPEELKDAVKKAEEESKKEEAEKKKLEKVEVTKASIQSDRPKLESVIEMQESKPIVVVTVKEKQESKLKEESSSLIKKESSPTTKPESSSSPSKQVSPVKKTSSPLDDLIKPVAAKESEEAGDKRKPQGEGSRKERVVRYNFKPESKWAPGLVDLLGPVRLRGRELDEGERFRPLCSPGVWDADLRTCIMPGEARSRTELARFLEAMRFGIALPDQ